jgi:hypothetical protein
MLVLSKNNKDALNIMLTLKDSADIQKIQLRLCLVGVFLVPIRNSFTIHRGRQIPKRVGAIAIFHVKIRV